MTEYFVDVWHGDFQRFSGEWPEMWSFLSPNEQKRAHHCISQQARQRYVLTRGLLRRTLANYLPVDPADLQFATGEHGKPYLLDEALYFNLSHAGDLLMLAIANINDIGVDIETMKPRAQLESLAERCFSSRELQAWHQIPHQEQLESFYRLWTKKEAFVKAVGRGLALGLKLCEFEIDKGGGLLSIPSEYGNANIWKVHELVPLQESYAASLVTPRCTHTFNQYRL